MKLVAISAAQAPNVNQASGAGVCLRTIAILSPRRFMTILSKALYGHAVERVSLMRGRFVDLHAFLQLIVNLEVASLSIPIIVTHLTPQSKLGYAFDGLISYSFSLSISKMLTFSS